METPSDNRPTDEHVEQWQAPRRENVVHGEATGGRRRMRRRPAAGASTSSAVDAEGTTENEVQDGNQDLLSNFVEYIKECMNRITSIEVMGRLSGVMDDRGKYISLKEMKAVADCIKRQGRVSISHLASKSNQFINLEPKVQILKEMSIAEEVTVA